MVNLLLIIAAAAAQPSPDGLRLGRVLAENGTLATLLPLVQQKETAELVANHPELSPAEKAALRATAGRVFLRQLDKLLDSEASAFAKELSIADLRAIAAFETSPAGRRYRAATPAVIGLVMQSLANVDYKKDVTSAYCAETGKLCAK